MLWRMRRAERRERLAQLQQRHREQIMALPDSQRGIIIVALLINALVTVVSQGVLAAAIIRSARRTWQHRVDGPAAATSRRGTGPGRGGRRGLGPLGRGALRIPRRQDRPGEDLAGANRQVDPGPLSSADRHLDAGR